MQPVKYFYSIKNSSFFTILFTGIIVISIPRIIKFVEAHDTANWLLIVAFDLIFLIMLLYVLVKQLIPALKCKVALEINSEGIAAHAKNTTIEWRDVYDIEYISGKTVASIGIYLKSGNERGNYIRIGLGFVAGDESKIYDTMKSFFETYKKGHFD